MRIIFKLDRQGEGINTTYGYELTMPDALFAPGLNDVINIAPDEESPRRPRVVYKRVFEINESNDHETVVKVYADEIMSLLRRSSKERREEIAKGNLWR